MTSLKLRHTVMETRVFNRNSRFALTAVVSFAGHTWLCTGQLHALGTETVPNAACITGAKVKL